MQLLTEKSETSDRFAAQAGAPAQRRALPDPLVELLQLIRTVPQ
jgi:hypothetical protein